LNADSDSLVARAWVAFRLPLAVIFSVHVIGAIGFWIISEGKASPIDCIYMVFITVAGIGYGEIVDLSNSPGGRLFNMVIAFFGISSVVYLTSKMAAFILEGRFDEVLRRRKMQDDIDRMKDHYIVCGVGRVGSNVVHELVTTERKFVAVDESVEAIEAFRERYTAVPALHGDASDDELLVRAGIMHAAGVFAITGDDGKNLLITLAAKHLNSNTRVVARCHEKRNIEKLKLVGADDIVSPDFTGGMRIASSMLRPAVVNFLDEMLRTDGKLRVEEVQVAEGFRARPLGEAAPQSREFVLLAVRVGDAWQFNPPADLVIRPGHAVVVMAHPEGRRMLEQALAA
jgi:voltage-gated potassium channel